MLLQKNPNEIFSQPNMLWIKRHRDEQIKSINLKKNLDTKNHIYYTQKIGGNAKEVLCIPVLTSASQFSSL